VNIHEGLESTLLILKHRLSIPGQSQKIHIVRDYAELPAVYCFPGSLNQVFMNILSNAIDAVEQYLPQMAKDVLPTITLRTSLVGDAVMVAIADNGFGMPEAVQGKVFDPFFTTKPVGQGTGMGMSISYQIRYPFQGPSQS
ncbi:MAG: ATP-binding protein, partial [Cyanobacteria bacterium J06560_5]